MTQKEFLDKLKLAYQVPNYYNNKYPYNCGYYDGKMFSFDCWNLIKSILGGWTDNRTPGYFVSPSKFPCGDCDGYSLLKQCHDVSKDFSKLSIPGTYLYMSTSPHSGVYVGDTVIWGKTYNVIECTGAWTKGVLYSYVDAKGRRLQYKGGSQIYSWTDYGLLPWVDYLQNPSDNNSMMVYNVCKGDTLTKISKKYNVSVSDLCRINHIANPDLIHVGQVLEIPIKTQQQSTSGTKDEKVYHIVQKGETLSSIARQYKTTYIKLAIINKIINPDKIYIGQKIRVR